MKTGLSGPTIVRILKQGARYTTGGITVISGGREEKAGFACVVSKKVVKRAVDRNRVRRRIREALRRVEGVPKTLVVIYRGGDQSYRSLRETLQALMKQINT